MVSGQVLKCRCGAHAFRICPCTSLSPSWLLQLYGDNPPSPSQLTFKCPSWSSLIMSLFTTAEATQNMARLEHMSKDLQGQVVLLRVCWVFAEVWEGRVGEWDQDCPGGWSQ